MKNSKLIKWGILHSLGVLTYIALLAIFMDNASSWFGGEDKEIITPIIVLLLFVFSALVTGALVLAKPIMLYVDGHKKEGIKLLSYTGLSIFVLILLSSLVLLISK
ncbi:MAG TPA: hypothetical protein PLE28_02840 [bacterium]|nr:hypothetical protein [bacterium]